MNNTIKAILGAALLTVVMTGCETMAERAANCPDGKVCDTAKCDDNANCDPSKCEKKDCPKKAACADGAKACPDGKAGSCKEGCTKPCCADKQACSHPNSTFSCPNCTDDKYCCAGCAAKDAAACPDCNG